MKKIISILMALICVTACAFSFAACGDNTPKHTHDYSSEWMTDAAFHWHECKNDGCESKQKDKVAHSDTDNNGKCDVCDYQMRENMKFDEFIAEHINEARDFVADYIRPEVIGMDKEVRSESWSIDATADSTQIDKVSILYTYDVNKTERAVELADVTLTSPVSINKIVDGEVKAQDIKLNVDRKTVFEFDAKDNYDNQAITNALYSSEGKKSDLKLISETEASKETRAAYNYLVANGGNLETYKVEVTKDSGSASDIIYNFENGYTYNTTKTGSYSMNGTNIKTEAYAYEKIEIENPGPGPGPGPIVTTVTDAEILNVLNEKVALEAAKNSLPASFVVNETNVKDATWYVTKEGDNVSSANLLFTYVRNDIDHYITLCKVDFASPLTPQNIKDGETGTPSYTRIYRANIDATIQDEHAALADAIGDKLFGVNETATRYIIDNGRNELDPQLGDIVAFTVIELTNSGIKENSIKIVYASTDAGLINNLGDTSKYATYGEEKSYEITGNKFEAKQEQVSSYKATKESVRTYFGEQDYSDDDLSM